MHTTFHGVLVVVFAATVASLFVAQTVAQEAEETVDQVSFETQIKPLLEKHCIRCHGPEEQEDHENDFRIDDRTTTLDYIDPGDSKNSDLYGYVLGEDYDQMPPEDEGGPLADEEIALVAKWIDQGADWPESITLNIPADEVIQEVQEQIAAEKQAEVAADKQQNTWSLVWEIVGLLHPMAVHFPVAMLIGGALFALFGFKGESPLADAAYYCLWLGAWGAIFACVTGWSFAFVEKGWTDDWQSYDFNSLRDVHRWGGILIAVLAFILALIAASSRRRDPYGTGAFWKLSMILLAAVAGFVSSQGGEMTHKGLHEKLQEKSTIVYESFSGGPQQEAVDPDQRERETDLKIEEDAPTLDEQPPSRDFGGGDPLAVPDKRD